MTVIEAPVIEGADWPLFGWSDDIRPALADAIEAGRAAVLATLFKVEGSAPRGPGAQMLFDGPRATGYFSGDCIEGDVARHAAEVLADGEPRILHYGTGSPWIDKTLGPSQPLPKNVTWGKLDRHALRGLYSRAAIAVVPIKQNHYQTGIATILEMMAMGKCVIATRTLGQTDTIVDGKTGIYVPPADPRALRAAIQRMLDNPAQAAEIGAAARRFIEENAGLDLFVRKTVAALKTGDELRRAS